MYRKTNLLVYNFDSLLDDYFLSLNTKLRVINYVLIFTQINKEISIRLIVINIQLNFEWIDMKKKKRQMEKIINMIND